MLISKLYEEIKREVQHGGTFCLQQFDSFGDKVVNSDDHKINKNDQDADKHIGESDGSSMFRNIRWDMKSNKLLNSFNNKEDAISRRSLQ